MDWNNKKKRKVEGGAVIVVQRAKPPLALHSKVIDGDLFVLLPIPAIWSGKTQQMMAQLFRPIAFLWETQMKFLAPGL